MAYQFVAGLSELRPRLDPRSVHVRFVMDKVALGKVYFPVLRLFPVSGIPPLLHIPAAVSSNNTLGKIVCFDVEAF